MGGGDLNSKKSWHPNTMKNQERVWKAEQAAAEEKKRILELQRERAEERTRSELNDLAKRNSGSVANDDNRLHWMYDKPDKKAKDEDYLLGKTIEANYGQSEKTDADVIPAVARRVVGSSMLTSVGDLQVDLARKIREDPLVLVKERERAARAALLNNPLQRRRLAELLRKDQEQAKVSKKKKKSGKKNLDTLLAAKISSLGGDKNIDLAALLASDDSSSDSSSEDENEKRKKAKNKHEKTKKKTKHVKTKKSKKKKKKSNKSPDDDTESSDSDKKEKCKTKHKYKKHNGLVEETYRDHKSQSGKTIASHTEIRSSKKTKDHRYYSNEEDRRIDSRQRVSPKRSEERRIDSRQRVSPKRSEERNDEMEELWKRKKCNDTNVEERFDRHNSSEDRIRDRSRHRISSTRYRERESETEDRWQRKKREGMSEGERAAKLAEMVAAGAQRELERERRVAEQRAADAAVDAAPRQPRGRNAAQALPDSLESRIHSNRHYIQRDQRHMNEHFARR